MLMLNGTDYTIPVFVTVSVILLFLLQYSLCKRCKKKWVKLLSLLYVLLWLVLALVTFMTPGNGFIDLNPLVAMLFAIYALICAAPIGLAWLVYRQKTRKEKPSELTELIVRIKNLFIELNDFLKAQDDHDMWSTCRHLDHIIESLELYTEQCGNEVDDNEIVAFIEHSYEDLFGHKDSLSEYCIWHDDSETRQKLNEPLNQIRNELAQAMGELSPFYGKYKQQ